MSGSGFTVDLDGLAQSAPQYSAIADDLDEALTTLKQTLDSLGNYWGDDDAGREYAQSYVPARDSALAYHSQIVDGLRSMSDTVTGWANGYAGADNDVLNAM